MEQYRPAEEMTFKELVAELEAVVRTLENNQLELEEALASYERGVILLRASKARLDEAQQKVTVLMGELEVESDDAIDTQLS